MVRDIWYNLNIVAQRIFSLLLLCGVLLSSVLSVGNTSAWVCDGRVCSTAAVCCCQAPSRQQDAKCRERATNTTNARKEDGCGAGCKCKLVVKAATSHDAAIPSHVVVPPAVAVFPVLQSVMYAAPPASETVLLHIETRGPPRSPLNFRILSLRAPPIA